MVAMSKILLICISIFTFIMWSYYIHEKKYDPFFLEVFIKVFIGLFWFFVLPISGFIIAVFILKYDKRI